MKINAQRVAQRWAATTPLPTSFPANEVGLLTVDEYLKLRNPTEKHHPSDSYDFDVMRLNHSLEPAGSDSSGFELQEGSSGFVITQREDDKVVAVLHKGTLYHASLMRPKDIPTHFRNGPTKVPLDIQQWKPVKYVSEFVPLVSNVAERNRQRFPHLLKNTIIRGEPFQLRSEEPPKTNKGTMLVVLNSKGEIVAEASNEWGATLLTVAQEYRGLGLGQLIGQAWYGYNPDFESGGFTNAGESNAVRMWAARVREFLNYGWYSELIRQRRTTRTRINEILAGLPGPKPRMPVEVPETKSKGETLVYADGVTFVVYDSRFLEEQDEKYIHGYGFFRNEDNVKGTFLYTIDYERPYQELVTLVALQMARDNHEMIYVGKGYGDTLEIDNIPNIERDGDHIQLIHDALLLKNMSGLERRTRREKDPYGEIESLLLEMAESKWR